jgi:Holliday junction DNA helicase RuvA
MIGYLTGKIISSKPTRILLDVNGVGYLVNISIGTFEKINEKEIVSLYIYTSVREDAITLFGFFSESEKEMFEYLISVNGVGPKLAIGILSGIRTDELKTAILVSDISRIVAIPGIGRKTAERLVLELKNKIDSVAAEGTSVVSFSIKNEAVAALTTLGYNSKIAENAVRNVIAAEPDASLEEVIKRSLSQLNR